MKNLIFFLLLLLAGLSLNQGCDFKVIPNEEDVCIDSLEFTCVVKGDSAFFTSSLQYKGKTNDLAYSWSFGASGVPGSSSPNPTVRYQGAGNYIVSLVVSAPFCDAQTFSRTIKVGAKPVAQFTMNLSPSTGVAPVTVSFVNTSLDTVGATYLWDFGGTGTSTVRMPPSRVFAVADTFPVKLTVKSPTGESDDTTINVIVKPLTFNHSFDFSTSSAKKAILVDGAPDGTWRMIVNAGDQTLLAKISANGTQVLSTEVADIDIAPTESAEYGIKTSNGYAAAGYALFSNGVSTFHFINVNQDFSLETVRQCLDISGNPSEGHGIAESSEGFVLCGSGKKPGVAGMQFFRLDASDNPFENPLYFTSATNFNTAYAMVRTPGGFAVAGRKLGTPGYEACLVTLDSDAHNPQAFTLTNLNVIPREIVLLPNNEHVLMICQDGSTSRMFKIALSGGAFSNFSTSLGNTTINRAIISSDGNLVMVGDNGSGVILRKINLTTGNLVWSRQYTGLSGLYVTELPDGGFLIGGTNNTNEALLIRTNTLGEL